jgi:hypothetical protein
MSGEMTNKHQQVINPAQQHQKVLNAPVYSGYAPAVYKSAENTRNQIEVQTIDKNS